MERGRLDLESDLRCLGGLAECVPGLECSDVGRSDFGGAGELLLGPVDGRLGGTVEQPGEQTKGEEVLGAKHATPGHAGVLDGFLGEVVHGDRDHPVPVEGSVLERVTLVSGLGQVALVEGVGVQHQRPALLEVLEVLLQSRRVHRHQAIGRVAGGEDVEIGDLDLEARHSWERPCRRPDLGRERREGRQVVPE